MVGHQISNSSLSILLFSPSLPLMCMQQDVLREGIKFLKQMAPVFKEFQMNGIVHKHTKPPKKNDHSLLSHDRAVEILKNCAMSNSITLLISRDPKTQSDFRRLSASLLLKDTPKGTHYHIYCV